MKAFIRRVYFLGLLFALAGGFNTLVGIRSMEVPLKREIERSISFKLEHITSQISAYINQAEIVLESAETVIGLESDYDKIHRFFQDFLLHHESFLSIYFGTPENKFVYTHRELPPTGVDVRTRPWYQAAVREGQLVFTLPYLDAVEERLVITMAKPIYNDQGQLSAVVGIDKFFAGILELLEQEKPSPQGHSFLFDSKGEIIIHPHNGFREEETRNIFTVVGRDFTVEPAGTFYTSLHGLDGYLRWQLLSGLNLAVGTFAPISDFFDPAAQNRQLAATMFLSFVVGFSLLFFFQRRHIVAPMEELERDILAIRVDEGWTYRLPKCKAHPFIALRRTINTVLANTQEQFENVMSQQEELTAAYDQLLAHEQQLQFQYGEIKEHEAHIQFLADHDPLTGMYNRRKFNENLEERLKEGCCGAVLMLDIDDFKNINDTQGHVYGDMVLRSVAKLLDENLPADVLTYRFGGDEFLVIIDSLTDEEIRLHIAELALSLQETSTGDGRCHHITFSMGVVWFPKDGTTVDELLIKVDLAMHNAKQKGKNCYVIFEKSMAAKFKERVRIEGILIEAIRGQGFMLLYQPIVEAQSGEIAYFEALLRLQGYYADPAVFIAIAEESNLILPIGRWVIEEAIQQLAMWMKTGQVVKPISINLSPKQFYDAGLVSFLTEQLESNDVDPALLEMEITETVFIDNPREAIKIIERIKALGIRMALDDFGIGYSSINYITMIPIDRIKLDRSMIRKLAKNAGVVRGLITIAHGLGMTAVAEGVETMDEALLLQDLGCDFLQGYLFSIPVPPGQAQRMLEAGYDELLRRE